MGPAGLIAAVSGALEHQPDVRALFLSGSYGSGLEDRHSDIDFLAVVAEGREAPFPGLWRQAISLAGEIVLWRERPGKSLLINAVTRDWLRIDVQALTPSALSGRARDGLKPLFDHDGVFDALPETAGEAGPNIERMRWQIEEFIRILGLLPVAMGRQEYLNGITGVFHLRNLLVDLLVEETGAPHRGGALHLNRLITQEQKDALASLPPLVPTRDAVIAAHLACAAAYLPRARALARSWGIDWPERFEAAMWDHLKARLAIERPDGVTR